MSFAVHEHTDLARDTRDRAVRAVLPSEPGEPRRAADLSSARAGPQAEQFDSTAHDMRNLLAIIQANAQLLARLATEANPQAQAPAAERIASIEAAVQQLDAQIEQLERRPARAPLGRPTDLAALARRCAIAYRQPGCPERIRVEARGGPVLGSWDAVGLACVLDNLVSNAIKYSPADAPITIHVGAEHDLNGDWAVLRVCDRGIGIPANALPHIFEPYYRAANVPPDVEGTGLGLASVRRLIEADGGTFSVRSSVDRGSCFSIRLPLA